MANKLTTLGYFLKRMRDSGFYCHKLFTDYNQADPRIWTIIINPKQESVFCTCFLNDPYLGESYFELFDGNQYIPNRLKLKTSSIEIVIEHLIKHNIYPTAKI